MSCDPQAGRSATRASHATPPTPASARASSLTCQVRKKHLGALNRLETPPFDPLAVPAKVTLCRSMLSLSRPLKPGHSESYFAVSCIHRGLTSDLDRTIGVARVHMRQVRAAPHSCLEVRAAYSCLTTCSAPPCTCANRLWSSVAMPLHFRKLTAQARGQGWFELHDVFQGVCGQQKRLQGECKGVAAINLEVSTIELLGV